jgi:hypothetical protein
MLKRFIPVLFAVLSGCSPSFPPTTVKIYRDDAITIIKDSVNNMPQSLIWNDFGMYNCGSAEWLLEASKRFNNPVVFHCHGGIRTDIVRNPNGTLTTLHEWWVYPDPPRSPMRIDDLATTLTNLYPDRDIVLVTCNPGGFDINVKRVFYAKRNVWTIPDANATGFYAHEQIRDFDTVGSIWEFVSNGGLGGPATTQPAAPTTRPTTAPSTRPTTQPATRPTTVPTTQPTVQPRPKMIPVPRPSSIFTKDEIMPLRGPSSRVRP